VNRHFLTATRDRSKRSAFLKHHGFRRNLLIISVPES